MNPEPSHEPPRRDDLSAPTDASLTERERRYRTLFGAMEEGFCVVEMEFDGVGKALDYRFREFNDAFGRMTGIPAEAALAGRSARDLVPALETFWFETYGRVALTGESVRFEHGAEAMGRWFEVHAFRIGGEGSREVGILFKDASERRRQQVALAEERARQNRILETAGVATFDWDAQNDRVTANRLLARYFGVSLTDAQGGPLAAYFAAIHPEDRERTQAAIGAALAIGGPYEAEYRTTGDEGRERVVLARGDATLDESGAPLRLSGVVLDITDRKRAEEERERLLAALRVEREKLRTIFEQAPAIIAVLRGPDLVFEYVNEGYYQTTGHRPMVGLTLAQALPEATGGGEGRDYDRLLRDIMDAGAPKAFSERPVLLQRVPGGPPEERFLDLAYLPLRETDGTVTGVLVHGIDVTESVLARRRVEASEARYRTLFTTMSEGYCVVEMVLDAEGRPADYRFVTVNDAFERLTGIPLEDARSGRTIREMVPGIDAYFIELYGRVALRGEPEEYERYATPLDRWYEGRVVPFGEPESLQVAVLFNEVTGAKRAEIERERLLADLAAEREKLDTVLALSPSFVTILRGESLVFEYANPAYKRAVGREDLVGRTLAEALPEVVTGGSAGQEYDRFLTEVMANGTTIHFNWQSIQLETTPGRLEERILDFTYQPLREVDGRVTGVLVHGTDVTDRARAERAIAEREELFRTVFEQAPDDAILVMDRDRTVTAWNPAAERVTGWTTAEAVGQPADLIFTPEDRAQGAPAGETETAARDGKALDERWHLRKDGSRFWGSGTMNALHGAEGGVRGFLKVFRDATARFQETRNLAFLTSLSAATAAVREAGEAVATGLRMLAEHLGAVRAAFAEADDGPSVTIRDEWAPGLPSLAGRHPVAGFSPGVADILLDGQPHVSTDAARDFEGAALDRIRALGAGSGLTVPLLKDGRLAGLLLVHHREPRAWSPDEIDLVRAVADRLLTEAERARAEAELRASEERFRVAQEANPEPFTILRAVRDEAGRIADFRWTYLNPATERLTGEPNADRLEASAVGRGELRRGDALFDAYARTVETGEPFVHETPLAYGGRDYYMRLTVSKVGDGAATSFADLTERYVEAQTLGFLSLLGEAVADLRDPERILESTERMLGEYLGASRVAYGEFSADGETVTVPQEWGPEAMSIAGEHRFSDYGEELAKALTAGRTFVVRDANRHFADEASAAAARAIGAVAGITVPIVKEGRLAAVFVVNQGAPRDWTDDEIGLVQQVADRMSAEIERSRAERALRESKAGLETTVEARTEDLRRAVAEAEGFNYSISHDLRSPLRAIVATASILLEEAGPELSEEHREMLVRQSENSKKMGRLIDELLRLSRLSRVKVSREPLDVGAVARIVFEEIAGHGEANGCRLEVQPGLGAEGDPNLVRTVLQNLIGNACKFSPRGGTVRVGREGGAFYVRDEGVGFDMRFAHKVFLPFERLVAESEFPGTGIGLANVKRIVERHEGRVWAESEPGKGATFWFTLTPV